MSTVINPKNSNDLTENIKNINIQQYNYFNANNEYQFSWKLNFSIKFECVYVTVLE